MLLIGCASFLATSSEVWPSRRKVIRKIFKGYIELELCCPIKNIVGSLLIRPSSIDRRPVPRRYSRPREQQFRWLNTTISYELTKPIYVFNKTNFHFRPMYYRPMPFLSPHSSYRLQYISYSLLTCILRTEHHHTMNTKPASYYNIMRPFFPKCMENSYRSVNFPREGREK